MSISERARRVTTLVLDVDGVLTDGTFWWGAGGEEWKRFSFRDVMGVSLARRSGLRVVLISGEASPLIDRFALKMGIVDVHQGIREKGGCLQGFLEKNHIPSIEVCYVGDDINDIPAMDLSGFPVTVRNAHPSLRSHAALVTESEGGAGAVREVVDLLLGSRDSREGA